MSSSKNLQTSWTFSLELREGTTAKVMLRGSQFGPLDTAVITVTATTRGQWVNSELSLWVLLVSQDSKPQVKLTEDLSLRLHQMYTVADSP